MGTGSIFDTSDGYFQSSGKVYGPGDAGLTEAQRIAKYNLGGILEQQKRNQTRLDEIFAARQAYPAALAAANNSPAGKGVTQLSADVAANPVSISDSVKSKITGAESDQALRGYSQGRMALNKALASAGALDSPQGAAKGVQMATELGGQLGGIRRNADILQATTNHNDRIGSLNALAGVQGQQANQGFTAAAGTLSAQKQFAIPDFEGNIGPANGTQFNSTEDWNNYAQLANRLRSKASGGTYGGGSNVSTAV